jgi:uncharacterized surface protein with fasciclin (FAS1) repeats
VLASNGELSSLNDQMKKLPHFNAYLDALTQITFLAPSNDALVTFFSSTMGKAASQDAKLLEAILTYHVQNGTWYQPANSPRLWVATFHKDCSLQSSEYQCYKGAVRGRYT